MNERWRSAVPVIAVVKSCEIAFDPAISQLGCEFAIGSCDFACLRNRKHAKSHVRLRNRKIAANSQAGIAISQGCEIAIEPAKTQNNCEFAIDPANSRGLRNRNLACEIAQLRDRSCKCDFAGFHDRDGPGLCMRDGGTYNVGT